MQITTDFSNAVGLDGASRQMGKDLHPTILPFLVQRMEDHDRVTECSWVEEDDHYFLEIKRVQGDSLRVILSDQYLFTELDFEAIRSELNAGDFVLVARPEASFTEAALEAAKREKIGLGKIGELMGALNWKRTWEYRPKPKK